MKNIILIILFILPGIVWGDNDNHWDIYRAVVQSASDDDSQTTRAFANMVQENAHASNMRKAHAVNDFFNRHIRYGKDAEIWGRMDYWATLLETLRKGAGDCEDFAIAKYAALRMMGVSKRDISIAYVEVRGGVAHMVVLYYPDGNRSKNPLVLDNMVRGLWKKSPLMRVAFEFNEDSLIGSTGNLHLWKNVEEKIVRESNRILSSR